MQTYGKVAERGMVTKMQVWPHPVKGQKAIKREVCLPIKGELVGSRVSCKRGRGRRQQLCFCFHPCITLRGSHNMFIHSFIRHIVFPSGPVICDACLCMLSQSLSLKTEHGQLSKVAKYAQGVDNCAQGGANCAA